MRKTGTRDENRRVNTFTQAGALLAPRLRGAGARRGFAELRLLTRWREICGPELAALARPVKVSYGREGFGATLVLACAGPRAPELQMQAETIRERVNACYGYSAIARIRLQQEDAAGFAEAQKSFVGEAPATAEPAPDPALASAAAERVSGVGDDGLRAALEALSRNIMARSRAAGDRGDKA